MIDVENKENLIEFKKDYLQPGQKLRIYYSKKNRNNKKIEIRAIVDEDYIVYKYYYHFNWHYKLDYIYYFYLLKQDRHLFKQNKRKGQNGKS